MIAIDPDEGIIAVVAQGYMGTDAWCYWAEEYPDEGSCGPFETREEAVRHARAEGYEVDPDHAH